MLRAGKDRATCACSGLLLGLELACLALVGDSDLLGELLLGEEVLEPLSVVFIFAKLGLNHSRYAVTPEKAVHTSAHQSANHPGDHCPVSTFQHDFVQFQVWKSFTQELRMFEEINLGRCIR